MATSDRGPLGYVALAIIAAFSVLCPVAARANQAEQSSSSTGGGSAARGGRWTLRDIVEVQRITGTAIRGDTRIAAFIVRHPSLSAGKNRYAIYMLNTASGGKPRKLVEADYIADLAWRPNTNRWTFRADLGQGVQLYETDGESRIAPIVVVRPTAPIGGSDGYRRDQVIGTLNVGVLSYEWAPDGRTLWYSRARLRGPSEGGNRLQSGIVYDDTTIDTMIPSTLAREVNFAGTELRLYSPTTRHDRLVKFLPATPADLDAFRRDNGGTRWAGKYHIQYRLGVIGADGLVDWKLWQVDIQTGSSVVLPTKSPDEIATSGASPSGLLVSRRTEGTRHLLEIGSGGEVLHDYGATNEAGDIFASRLWTDGARSKVIAATRRNGQDGLTEFPSRGAAPAFTTSPYDLENCAFNTSLTFGVCSRESMLQAPELVSISVATGELVSLYKPNEQYEHMAPLRTEWRSWKNKYGAENSGWVTYPRNYIAGLKYPAVLITHARDAGDRFARDGFQWEFPAQVFAEENYFVLSVNEPAPDPTVLHYWEAGSKREPVERQQFDDGLNPTASMEAAAQSLVDSGDVDSNRIGIAGYSRGAELVTIVMSQSRMFRAASIGDDSGRVASGYWASRFGRAFWKDLFGGSPFDPEAQSAYQRYSISFRVKSIAGPILQQYTGASAISGMELDQLMKADRIPTELVAYPGEPHIFYGPRQRLSAMRRNLEWFDYWLRGIESPRQEARQQYQRWDRMRAEWNGLNSPAAAARPIPGR